MPDVRTGIEALIKTKFYDLRGKRVGLLTNPSAVTRGLVSAYDVFRTADAFTLAALFSPEHGFAAAAADGEHVASGTDPRTGVPVHSLYGPSLHPTPDMLRGLDVIVCDIQDIGVRYYTYAWTITHMIEAAGAANIPVIVLDRPNPCGSRVDGPLLDSAYASLVGRCSIPIQHGLTMGELMMLFNQQWNSTPADLTIQACDFYQREMTWEAMGLPFVPPSPAMPHLSTVQHYPGACLLEGTNISEGRGTAIPFEIFGAPSLSADDLADALNAEFDAETDGVRFRPHIFKPTASKFAGEVCEGVQVHRLNANFRPLVAWIGVIAAIRRLYPASFEWKEAHFDRLAGSDVLRGQIESGMSAHEIAAAWAVDHAAWAALPKMRLYDEDAST